MDQLKDKPEYLHLVLWILNTDVKHLPIFYYLNEMQLNREQAIELIENMVGWDFNIQFVLQRIRGEYTYFKELKNTGTAAYKRKEILREKLLKNLDVQIRKEEVTDFTSAFRSLSADAIRQNKEYYNAVIKSIYQMSQKELGTSARNEFRQAVCYYDEVLYS